MSDATTRAQHPSHMGASGSGVLPARPWGAVVVVTTALFAALAFATLPTPLYALYAERDGYGTAVSSVVFSVYVVGVLAALWASDRLARRFSPRVLIIVGLAASILASVLLSAHQCLPTLVTARLLTGIGIGLCSSCAVPVLYALLRPIEPSRSALVASLLGSEATMLGLGAGAVLSGFLASVTHSPLTTPYVTAACGLLVALVAVAMTPLPDIPAPAPSRRHRLPDRPSVIAAGAAATGAFAVTGMFGALAPTVATTLWHIDSLAARALVAASVFLGAGIGQLVVVRLRSRAQVLAGLLLMLAGLLVIISGVYLPTVWGFVAGGLVAGAGVGITFRCALATATQVSGEAAGHANRVVLLSAYASVGVLTFLLGLGFQLIPIELAVPIFVAILFAGLIPAGVRLLHVARTPEISR